MAADVLAFQTLTFMAHIFRDSLPVYACSLCLRTSSMTPRLNHSHPRMGDQVSNDRPDLLSLLKARPKPSNKLRGR